MEEGIFYAEKSTISNAIEIKESINHSAIGIVCQFSGVLSFLAIGDSFLSVCKNRVQEDSLKLLLKKVFDQYKDNKYELYSL